MPYLIRPLLLLCAALLHFGTLFAQSKAELENRLLKATQPEEQWDIHYKLSRNWLVDSPGIADFHAQQAVRLAIELKDKKLEAQSLIVSGDIARRKGDDLAAVSLYTRGRAAANISGLPDVELQAVESLLEISVRQKNYKLAYEQSQARATLLQERTRRYTEEQRQKYESAQTILGEQKNREVQMLMASIAAFFALIAFFYYTRQRANRRTAGEFAEKNALIEEKRRRSEQLLLNILPRAVAAELTIRNKVAARRYEQATVMFVDFVGFTQSAERLEPEVLVAELDHCFSRFDDIISRFRIEKIKTVGDAYLCASGLSDHNERPTDMIRAALQIQAFLQKLKTVRSAEGRPYFEARIGIHFGPVVAGVVGTKKFAYDIWGDTVNTAARTEEICEAGRVNVTGAVHDMAAEEFQWEYRGKLAAKNKVEMEMWYCLGSKETD